MSARKTPKTKRKGAKAPAGRTKPITHHSSPITQPTIVVEDDAFTRIIQIVLDPAVSPDRVAAFSHFFAHELPDFPGWCERLRGRLSSIQPARVELVATQEV